MGRILAIASGKGGVGKSLLAANLGVALARLGRTVVLVDLDLGGSNLHLFLGVRNRNPGLGSLLWKKERSLAALLTETGEERLWLILGDNLLPGTANLEWQAKRRIIKELATLPADFVILDLGGGSSWNVVDFWLAGDGGLLVAVPEITSILNSYSFLKTAAYRLLTQAFAAGSAEREEVLAFVGSKGEGGGSNYIDFARKLAERDHGRGRAGLHALENLLPCVVMNRSREETDVGIARRLAEITLKNLGIKVAFGAILPEDETVAGSLALRRPLVDLDPRSTYARGVRALASRLSTPPRSSPPQGPLIDLDLDVLSREALEAMDSSR
jgi:flagellar biosynthesis protein FlhG